LFQGFAASRNRKSEEERSPERLEEAEKKLAHPKNHFSKRESRRRTSAVLKSSHHGKNSKHKREGWCLLIPPKT